MPLKDLPIDVMEDIFARLPVKSLTRFKCLSKSFCGNVTSLAFITKHYNFHSNLPIRNHPLLLITKYYQIFRRPLYKYQDIKLVTTAETSRGSFYYQTPIELKPLLDDVVNDHLVIFGPCNGIFCLSYRHHDCDNLILWNPATREVKVLPPPHLKSSESAHPRHGFGVDPKNQQYKVVRIFSPYWQDVSSSMVEVYNISTDSWTIIDVPMPDIKTNVTCRFSVFFNGVSHWFSEYGGEEEILCFNMSNEVFLKMKLPNNEGKENFCHGSNVAVIDNSIAYVLSYSKDECSECWFEIWVMKDYGIEESWTKRYTIGPHPRLYSFWGFQKDGEILAGDLASNLFSFNFDLQQMQEFHTARYGVMNQVFRFVETLFPLSVLAAESLAWL